MSLQYYLLFNLTNLWGSVRTGYQVALFFLTLVWSSLSRLSLLFMNNSICIILFFYYSWIMFSYIFWIFLKLYILWFWKSEWARERTKRRINLEILHILSLHYTKNTLNERDNTYLFSIWKMRILFSFIFTCLSLYKTKLNINLSIKMFIVSRETCFTYIT
jgi:hypothetical protein